MSALGAEQDDLDHLISGLDEQGWQRASRCTGWTVADVVLHLAQTNELATASARDRFADVADDFARAGGRPTTIDDVAAQRVEQERAGSGREVADRWRVSVDTLRTALLDRDPRDRVQWVVGQLSVLTLATTRIAETWIHAGDVAHAFGVVPAPTGRLRHIARLAWRTLPYAFARAGESLTGPVAFALHGPNDDRWEFGIETAPVTTIRGPALDLCLVAARRLEPANADLEGTGPDAERVLELVRTYA